MTVNHLASAFSTSLGRAAAGALLLLCAQAAGAQAPGPWSNLRIRMVDAWQPLQQLDSLTVAPPPGLVTDSTSGAVLPAALFGLSGNRLTIDTAGLRRACPDCRRLRVSYRVLPYDFGASLQRLDTGAIRRATRTDAIEFDYAPYEPATRPWESAGLVSNGAYTRGLSFGNSQNLVFNSNLNLQLDGKLGNDLELQAALSDNSIPLQPDGTTRQLQEFDRIFIQLKRKNVALTAGDYDLARPPGYFANYFKRLQGVKIEINPALPTPPPTPPMKGGEGLRPGIPGSPAEAASPPLQGGAGGGLALAISRGKFARQSIAGQEGNQGPYRLQGAEGERFIIVLAGTEKVYVDGVLLERGLTGDYVIDYNLGEVTFTPRQLITKDRRIIVEFEYAVQAFLRSTMEARADWRRQRSRVYLNVYSEQDSKNSGGGQDLRPEDRRRLAEAGDRLADAYSSGIDTLAEGFDPGRVQYKYVDTVACNLAVRVLVYSTSPDSARYAARFTEVPSGQGNYVQVHTSANGRVFRWVAPDTLTCRPSGNFEPVVRLIAPEQRQMFTLGAEASPFRRGLVRAEAAVSSHDVNRFSPLGNEDNYGAAGYVALQQHLLPERNPHGWQLQLQGSYEYAARAFRPLNPYRPAEFSRDWNIALAATDTVTEHLGRGGLAVEKDGWGRAHYEFGAFYREGAYEGRRHLAQARLQRRGFDLILEGNWLETTGLNERTRFDRPKADLSKTFFHRRDTVAQPWIKIGVYGERERNERYAAGADTLNRASFWYDLGRVYFQTPEQTGRWQWGGSLTQRSDFFPVGTFFRQNTLANEANLNGRYQNNQDLQILQNSGNSSSVNSDLQWNVTWRELRVLAPELTDQEPQTTYLGRIDYNLGAWKNALQLTTGYEISSGQSPRVEFNYLEVNPGEGQYTWVDRNLDSILQVDEMEIAVFQDQASFIRVAVTTTEYIRTNNVVFNQNLRLDPRVLWSAAKDWRRLGRRLSTLSLLQINRRVNAGAAGVSAWNPFALAVADTALITVSSTLRNVLYLNRADPLWDASLGQTDNRSRVFLTTGFESRRLAEYTLQGRVNLSRAWSLEAEGASGERSSANEGFASRNYAIDFWRAGPKLTWLPSRHFRIAANWSSRDSRNRLGAAETARQTDWKAELSWNPPGRPNDAGFRPSTLLRASATLSEIRYSGQPNTPVAYAMLEGLQNGRNLLWSLSADRQLTRSMQLSLQYEGRKTGENRVVHVGRAQVRAVF